MAKGFLKFPTEIVEQININYEDGVYNNRIITNANEARVEYQFRLTLNGYEEVHATYGRLNGPTVNIDYLYTKYDEKLKQNFLYYYTVDIFKRGKYTMTDKVYRFTLHRFPEKLIHCLIFMSSPAVQDYEIRQAPRSISIKTKKRV